MTERPSTALALLSQRAMSPVISAPAVRARVAWLRFAVVTVVLLLLNMMPSLALGQATTLSVDGDRTFLDGELTPEFLVEYEARLNAILKTRSTNEKKFIADLVAKVKVGALPVKLISTSFRWVQENRPESNYPFIYFEKVLRLQAGKLGLAEQVPPFEFSEFLSAGQRRGETAEQAAGDGDATEPSGLITLFSSASGRVAELFRLGASKLKMR